MSKTSLSFLGILRVDYIYWHACSSCNHSVLSDVLATIKPLFLVGRLTRPSVLVCLVDGLQEHSNFLCRDIWGFDRVVQVFSVVFMSSTKVVCAASESRLQAWLQINVRNNKMCLWVNNSLLIPPSEVIYVYIMLSVFISYSKIINISTWFIQIRSCGKWVLIASRARSRN